LLTSLLAVMKLLLLAVGLVLLQLFRAAVTELLEHWLIPAAGSEWLLYWVLLAAGLHRGLAAAVTKLLEHWLLPAAGSECWLLLYWLLLAAGLHRGLAPPLLRSSARSQLVRLQPVDLLSFLLERRRRFVVDVPPT
jgi:hypothetical protein